MSWDVHVNRAPFYVVCDIESVDHFNAFYRIADRRGHMIMTRIGRENMILKALANANLSGVSYGSEHFCAVIRNVMERLVVDGIIMGWGAKLKNQEWYVGWSTVVKIPTVWMKLPTGLLVVGGFDIINVMDS